MSLLKNVLFDRVLVSTAAGTSDTISTDIVDLAGYDGVCFVWLLGDLTSTADLVFNLQQDDLNGSGGMADVGSTAGLLSYNDATATDHDSKLVVQDCYRPGKRYVRAQVDRSTANAVIDGCLAILYKGRDMPITQGSDVGASILLISPAE